MHREDFDRNSDDLHACITLGGEPKLSSVWLSANLRHEYLEGREPQYANYWAPLTRKRKPCHIQHSPGTPTTGLRERGNDTSRSTGRSGRQNTAADRTQRRNAKCEGKNG